MTKSERTLLTRFSVRFVPARQLCHVISARPVDSNRMSTFLIFLATLVIGSLLVGELTAPANWHADGPGSLWSFSGIYYLLYLYITGW
jgi:hypothetical protein